MGGVSVERIPPRTTQWPEISFDAHAVPELAEQRRPRRVQGANQKRTGSKNMLQLFTYLNLFRHDKSGATAIEYSLLAALIAVAIIIVVGLLGGQIVQVFQDACQALNGGEACV